MTEPRIPVRYLQTTVPERLESAKHHPSAVLLLLLAALIVRLWLVVLPSSFWIDEIATVFFAWHGSNHPSLLDAAPQAWRSWYYPAMRFWGTVFGFSEASMRVPSILAMGAVLALVARLSARLIHPEKDRKSVV